VRRITPQSRSLDLLTLLLACACCVATWAAVHEARVQEVDIGGLHLTRIIQQSRLLAHLQLTEAEANILKERAGWSLSFNLLFFIFIISIFPILGNCCINL
jgi:hypothetical protein